MSKLEKPLEVWHHDMFDRDTSPHLDWSGDQLPEALVQLWARYLFEGVSQDGSPGLARFTLSMGETSICIAGDEKGSANLRKWLYADSRYVQVGYVQDAREQALLKLIAGVQSRSTDLEKAARRILSLASSCASAEEFKSALGTKHYDLSAVAALLKESIGSKNRAHQAGALAWLIIAGLMLALGLALGHEGNEKAQTILIFVAGFLAFLFPITLFSNTRRNRRLQEALSAIENSPEKITNIQLTEKTFRNIPVHRVLVTIGDESPIRIDISQAQAEKIKSLISDTPRS